MKMASTATFLVGLSLIITFYHVSCYPDNMTTPPKYTINLDLPEEERWIKVSKDHKEIVPDVYNVFMSFLGKFPFANLTVKAIEAVAADIDNYLPKPYAGEMRGIAKALNMDLGGIVGMNILYDVTAFCTSIVTQDASGQIWHSRNLDYSFVDMLRNITIQVDFIKNNQTVYSGVTYAGYVGLITGMRPKAFTMTLDERDQGAWWENFIIALLDRKAMPISFLMRDTVAECTNFKDAVDKMAYTTTEASGYIIIGGVQKGEGMIITKGRIGPVDLWKLDPENGRWFEVETNYDHWVPPPSSDNRRDPAVNLMNKIGPKNITVETLMSVMSLPPVLNKKTTYTIVMSAAKPELTVVYVRHYNG
ncbi:N-acylethanolamine-hydrolyzing acid amidase-like [Saccostrea cucullata]|uniref:N-acylethanolamine-hydrolyzing acid amidase-like n=1 Tax=Saccostrea cuccullata TaxID=36930 RepID=UPI002ED111DB